MEHNDYKYPLVKLPQETDLILLLIREQLKAAKFFNTLMQCGLDDCYYQPHLETAILTCMGFRDIPDELMDFYIALLDKYSARVEPDNGCIMQLALAMYEELCTRKKF